MANLNIRSAAPRDIATARQLLSECIGGSPFYTDDFKRRELARLNHAYLRGLIGLHPDLIRLAEYEGETVGILLLIPDGSVMLTSWFYVRPRQGAAAAALLLFRTTWKMFEGTAFDKVCCFVRPENELALAMFKRMGFQRMAELKQHLWGQDVVLLEKPFENPTKDYDALPSLSLWQKIWLRIASILGV